MCIIVDPFIMQKLSYTCIYLTMTSDDVETSYISVANFCFENIPSNLTYSKSKKTET